MATQTVFEMNYKRIGVASRDWHFRVTSRRASRDYSIPHRPFPTGDPLEPSLYM